jgi:hypothetical protein
MIISAESHRSTVWSHSYIFCESQRLQYCIGNYREFLLRSELSSLASDNASLNTIFSSGINWKKSSSGRNIPNYGSFGKLKNNFGRVVILEE